MGKKVDRMIRAVAANVKPRPGQTKKAAAIAVLKARKLIRQAGKHLVLTAKGRKS